MLDGERWKTGQSLLKVTWSSLADYVEWAAAATTAGSRDVSRRHSTGAAASSENRDGATGKGAEDADSQEGTLPCLLGLATGGTEKAVDKGIQADPEDFADEESYFTKKEQARLFKNRRCSICLEALAGKAVTMTVCGHWLHRSCLNRADDPRCPVCRQALDEGLDVDRHLTLTALLERWADFGLDMMPFDFAQVQIITEGPAPLGALPPPDFGISWPTPATLSRVRSTTLLPSLPPPGPPAYLPPPIALPMPGLQVALPPRVGPSLLRQGQMIRAGLSSYRHGAVSMVDDSLLEVRAALGSPRPLQPFSLPQVATLASASSSMAQTAQQRSVQRLETVPAEVLGELPRVTVTVTPQLGS